MKNLFSIPLYGLIFSFAQKLIGLNRSTVNCLCRATCSEDWKREGEQEHEAIFIAFKLGVQIKSGERQFGVLRKRVFDDKLRRRVFKRKLLEAIINHRRSQDDINEKVIGKVVTQLMDNCFT